LIAINQFLEDAASITWWPVLFLIIGGGLYFLLYSGFIQYKYFFHAINVLRGKYDDPNAPGQITAYKALSTALASTVGMGNLAGVAAAIAMGGPGALFWMWVTSFIGMSTNFFTSALAGMYRGRDSAGELQGGPMYVIREALGKKWQPLATLFCVCCMVGALPIFQTNQLTQAIVDIGLRSAGIEQTFVQLGDVQLSITKAIIGICVTALCALVIVGGIRRIGDWAGRLVPAMIVLHFVSVVYILILFADRIPYYLKLIVTDAFTASNYHGNPFLGGIVGGLIMLGLISMLSPVIDTIISCSLTALSILVTDVWMTKGANGITLTSLAYRAAMPAGGDYVLLLCTFVFAISALFAYSYYGRKALSFMVGERRSAWYDYFYLSTIVIGAVVPMDFVVNLIDIAFALMAIPTMLSAFVLAPRVMEEARKYFAKL
jgi:AGCS family alanine or glycine:cation symporter